MIFASHTKTDSIGVQEFSQTDLPQTTIRSSSTATVSKIVALLIVMVGGYLGYEIILHEKKLADILAPLIGKNQDNIATSVVANIDDMIAPFLGSDSADTNVSSLESTPPVAADTQPAEIQPEIIEQPTVAPQPEPQPLLVQESYDSSGPNIPYQSLSNGVDGEVLPTGRVISAQEEEIWRSGLTHRFVYQRHKTVEDIINERLSGSEPLLEVALLNKKFWTRMAALFGLVNFGTFVSPELVELAIRDARESLVANYFKRFVQETAAHERYILRYALRFVNSKARLTILTALRNSPDQWTGEYLNAALNDPDPKISTWARDNSNYLNGALNQQQVYEQEVIDEVAPSS